MYMARQKVSVLSLGTMISSTSTGGSGISKEVTVNDLIELATEVTRRMDDGTIGVVITQGADTIEETAFVLDLLVDRDAPVVVTGEMRKPDLPGDDGSANLAASVQVAASDAARGLGTLVVLNDEIHAARFVRRTHTQNPSAFRSDPVGPIGWISEGSPRIATRPVGHCHVSLPPDSRERPVALFTAALDDKGRLLLGAKELGYEGLVVEALGGGHVPSMMVETLEYLVHEMPVVLAARAGSGEVLRESYHYPGSETDLLGRGLIHAGMLDGPKARLLLSLLLRSGANRDEISRMFDSWLDGLPC